MFERLHSRVALMVERRMAHNSSGHFILAMENLIDENQTGSDSRHDGTAVNNRRLLASQRKALVSLGASISSSAFYMLCRCPCYKTSVAENITAFPLMKNYRNAV